MDSKKITIITFLEKAKIVKNNGAKNVVNNVFCSSYVYMVLMV